MSKLGFDWSATSGAAFGDGAAAGGVGEFVDPGSPAGPIEACLPASGGDGSDEGDDVSAVGASGTGDVDEAGASVFGGKEATVSGVFVSTPRQFGTVTVKKAMMHRMMTAALTANPRRLFKKSGINKSFP